MTSQLVPQSRGGRAGHGGLQGVSQGQGSTALGGADLVDIPVPRSGGLQGFLPRQGSTASSSSSRVRAGAADEAVQGFCRTFPQKKESAGLGPHSGSELCADFNPWTPAMALDDDESETESESEEDVLTRFGAVFRPRRVSFTRKINNPFWVVSVFPKKIDIFHWT